MVNVPFVVLDSIAIFLVVVPMPWHVSAWNSATCYMMIWTVIGCIIHLINAIVWAGNLHNPAPVYCDIATKLLIGLSVALPLSSLCINRRLFNIARTQTVMITKQQKKRDILIDTLIAVGGPIIFMTVHYTMQGHRYEIIEDYGCWPNTYPTLPAVILVLFPPIIICMISLVYCTLSLRAFVKRRSEFNQLLRSSSTGLTANRYFRLMALASAEIIVGLPTSLYFLISNWVSTGLQPWISWADTHSNFHHVNYYPMFVLKHFPAVIVSYEMTHWFLPFTAFLFFGFFGFADEAIKNYKRAYYFVLKPFGVRPNATMQSSTGATGQSRTWFEKFPGRRSPTTSNTNTKVKFDFDDVPPMKSLDASASASALELRAQGLEMTMPDLDMSAFDAGEAADARTEGAEDRK